MNKDVKQVIIMRKDLKMRRGKECSQASHASMKVILDMMWDKKIGFPIHEYTYKTLTVVKDSPIDLWLNGLFTKICLQVNSEEELLELYEKAKEFNLPCSLIEDAGLTEFHGQKTITCAAIGPVYSENIDKITGHLKLL